MKKLVSWIAVLCLVLGMSANCFAVDTMGVTVKIQALDETWVDAEVKPEVGANANQTLMLAMEMYGIWAEGIENDYITSVENGENTLAAYDKGESSGWLYKVNGVMPSTALSQTILSDGDELLLYYTEDWNVDFGMTEVPEVMNVTVKVEALGETWLDSALETEIGANANVALAKALENAGIVATGIADDYITAVEKDGETLSAYDKGENSGWLFKINGEMPSSALSQIVLQEGDEVLLYFTEDWRIDFGMLDEGFSDVSEGAWYYDAVNFVVDAGYFKGTTKDTFTPDGKMTRNMMFTVLLNVSGDEVEASDVWYEAGLAWAMENGITDGTGGDNNLTREQFATMLYRYAKAEAKTAELEFADSDAINSYALEAVSWAVAEGLLTGRTGNVLAPQDEISRAEVATVLMRFC